MATAVSGVLLAGFQMTGLPATSAGAIFQTGIRIGKFHGVMMPTTPSGTRTVRMVSPGFPVGKMRSVEVLAKPAW